MLQNIYFEEKIKAISYKKNNGSPNIINYGDLSLHEQLTQIAQVHLNIVRVVIFVQTAST